MIQSDDKLLQIDLGEKHWDLDDPDQNSNVDEMFQCVTRLRRILIEAIPQCLSRILIKTNWMIISNCKTCLRVKQFVIYMLRNMDIKMYSLKTTLTEYKNKQMLKEN